MRFIHNFISMSRARATDKAADENSDDLLSDVELTVGTDNLAEALITNVGGRAKRPGEGNTDSSEDELAHHENSTDAMQHASDVWSPRGEAT